MRWRCIYFDLLLYVRLTIVTLFVISLTMTDFLMIILTKSKDTLNVVAKCYMIGNILNTFYRLYITYLGLSQPSTNAALSVCRSHIS